MNKSVAIDLYRQNEPNLIPAEKKKKVIFVLDWTIHRKLSI